jgi:SpoVK/Ycf46/Vps4 family AAA+-type ATPase
MAGRHIKELIAAYHARDDLAFRRAASAIIEEEEGKKHVALARDLRKLLASGTHSLPVSLDLLPEPPKDRESGVPLADVVAPDVVGLNDLVYPEALQDQLGELVDEVRHWPALDAAGVPRRNRVLLHGPPGNGKSTIAAAMAAELGVPLVITRIDSLVSSYLGETAANLRSLFEFAEAMPSVVLLDEFDSLGKERDDPSDHGELRRVVNAVLQMIDKYRGRALLIAATNNPEILDPALWRRFDEVIAVPGPGLAEIGALLRRLLPKTVSSSVLQTSAQQLRGSSYAAVEHVAQGARRRAVVARRAVTDDDVTTATVSTLSRRWN